MTRIYVVEDEERSLKTVLSMLADLPVEVVGYASEIEEAFRAIISKQPDLVFLDVEVGQRTSFELLEKFDQIPFKVVFITAHQKYAYDAFRFSALDFLLKPVSFSALEKVVEASSKEIGSSLLSVQALQHNLISSPEQQKLILRTQDKIQVLSIRDIIRCESDMSYTIFFTSQEKIVVSKTLGYYEELLSKHGFYRVHKSHLINLSHVVKIHRADGGEVELTDGSRIGIAQRKHEDFLTRLGQLGLS
ncbi:MAG: LytTR family DNA-binding domain-containing protein [Bacteroidota bacterium]